MKFSSLLKAGTENLVTFVWGGAVHFKNLNPIPGAPLVVKNDASLMLSNIPSVPAYGVYASHLPCPLLLKS